MRPFVVGVTGGVGCGKSECLAYLAEHTDSLVILADEEAAKLRLKGEVCYSPLVELLGEDVLNDDGEIDSGRMAARIFADPALLDAVNKILHPAVNERIRATIRAEREAKRRDYVFLEAALLIENGYASFVDEMWYIYADEQVRRKRLKESRGYTDEKIDRIFASQLTEEAYRAHCAVVIDNSRDRTATFRQMEQVLKEHIGGTERTAD